MMKKTALLIGSVAAVALLAGGTFAAYTITDNANPFGVKISPTAIEEDETGNVTLSWGQNTVTKVENIVAPSHNKSGNLVLKAENDADAEAIYNGKLSVSLEDLTARPGAYTGAKLIDYLTIDIYEGDYATYEAAQAASPAQHIQLAPSAEGHAIEDPAKGNKEGITYSVFVSLDANAGAGTVWSQINADKVYLQFDWNKNASDSEEVEATTVYVQTPNDWGEDIYVYSWKDDGQIGTFPGKAMTKVSSHLYSYELPNSYSNVIFTDVDGENFVHQTADQVRVLDDNKPYFVVGEVVEEGKYGGTWHASVAAHDYYLTGKIMGKNKWYSEVGYVEGYAMSTDPAVIKENLAVFEDIELQEGDELKIIDKNGVYYGTEGENANWVITADGHYKVFLNGNGNIWINPAD